MASWAPRQVNSPTRITLENNEKIRPQPDVETHFARVGGEGRGPGANLLRVKLRSRVIVSRKSAKASISQGLAGGHQFGEAVTSIGVLHNGLRLMNQFGTPSTSWCLVTTKPSVSLMATLIARSVSR